MKVMIAAAGTGGHVFPGLAVAQVLLYQQHQVVWLATEHGKVVQWVQQANLPLHTIGMTGVRGKGWLGWLKAPFQLLKAFKQALRIMREQSPDVLLVMGGYVSVPAGLAAAWLRIPLCVHEQNSVVGLSNRLLAPLSRLLFLGLPLQQTPMGWQSAILLGNPLRSTLQRQPKQLASSPLRLLVIGGSQGAQFLNERLPEVMQDWASRHALSIWHQTGSVMKTQVEQAYRQAGVEAKVSDFIEDMGAAYAWADLVIARAGALTVTELIQTARPAILIPFPYAVDDHQYHNSLSMVGLQAAEVVRQSEASVDYLRVCLNDYLGHPDRLSTSYALLNAQPENNAAISLAEAVISLAMKKNVNNQSY